MGRLVTFAITIAVFLSTHTYAGAGVVDQVWEPPQYRFGAAFYSGQSLAQTFTVGQTGILDRVEVTVSRTPTTNKPLVVEIHGTFNGAPSLGVLASYSLDAASLPTTLYTTTFTGKDLGAQAFHVFAGEQLAIVLSSQTGNYPDWYLWTTSDSAATPPAPQYPGGMSWASSSFNQWGWSAAQDAGFRTFVSVPEPPTLALAAIGGVALLKMRRRKWR
ncbi:MAG TPA: PEP-CTERM sorting domain-containing protein [Pirellulales bacterium]|nr:PEP-CTERM sorting domain-containing protein [Pirellulales bacterium]